MKKGKEQAVGASKIDLLQKGALDKLAKDHGFRKSGRRYWRAFGTRFDVMEIQVTRFGSSLASRFTINLYQHDSSRDDPHARSWTTFPTTGANGFSKRIGTLMPCGGDKWWEVDGSTDVAALGAEISTIIVEIAIPSFGAPPGSARRLSTPFW